MATKRIDWQRHIGRRLQLRDLHVFFTVVQCGSMAKAAAELGVSQPTVSEVIADLEHTYGVRLFDRSPQGVVPTIYGDALLKRCIAAFDELKQSGRDIEFLSDPTVGEVRIACMESLWYTLLPKVVLRFSELYPRVEVHADLSAHTKDFPGLRERKYDCIMGRVQAFLLDEPVSDDLNVESLFDEAAVVAAGAHTKWARRRKIELAELIDEPWAFGGPGTWHRALVEELFRARGLSAPKPSIATVSISFRARLLASGPYLSTFLPSVLRQLIADNYAVAALSVDDLPAKPFSASIVTLKNRTLSPVVERFLACVREVAKSYAGKPVGRTARSSKQPNVS
jgi:DNA-binding transcriptional LysR family regulator